MISSTRRTQIRWPLFQRFLLIACIIIFIPLTIAVLVVIGLIPVYLTNHAVYITRSTDAPPFNVTYVLVDQSTGGLNLDSIDRVKMARSFELALGLRVRNVLQIRDMFSDTAIGNNSQSRRKRLVKCEQDLSGPALVIDFNLTYPINRICQTQKCVNETFAEVYQQFQSVPSLSIDFNNIQRELRLCSFNPIPYSVPASVSNTQNSPIVSSSNEEPNIISASASSSNMSSTETPVMIISSSTTDNHTPVGNDSTTIDMLSTETSVTTLTSVSGMINGTESSNFTLNETDVDLTSCLKKIPITQEPVAPYRINSTSTLFFQDDHSLIVVGASKFETLIDQGTIKRTIIIDGVMVYKNCQRTFDLSLPMVCHCPISS